MTKASMSSLTITPAITKSKDNSYSKLRIDKCYKCDKPRHKSNECLKRRQVNMASYEEKDDVLIET